MNKVIHPGYRHTPTPVIAWGQALCLGAVALLMTGCSIAQPKTFSLEADVPENFTVTGTANYKPAPGQTCPRFRRRARHRPPVFPAKAAENGPSGRIQDTAHR